MMTHNNRLQIKQFENFLAVKLSKIFTETDSLTISVASLAKEYSVTKK